MTFRIPPASDKVAAPAWPVGLYHVMVDALEVEKENRYSELPRIRFEFRVMRVISTADRQRVMELLQAEESMMGWCNLTMGRKSVMRGWVEAIMGHPLVEGETPDDPSVLLGREVMVNVVQHTKDNGELTTKIGALQSIDASGDTAPIEAPTRRSGPTERVMSSAQAVTTRKPPPTTYSDRSRASTGPSFDDRDDRDEAPF